MVEIKMRGWPDQKISADLHLKGSQEDVKNSLAVTKQEMVDTV